MDPKEIAYECMNSSGTKLGPVVGYWEYGDEISVSIKYEDILISEAISVSRRTLLHGARFSLLKFVVIVHP
jgi:hypothetical protein